MKARKIFYATSTRRELEPAATAAFEDIASATAAQNPALDRAECRRSAQYILEDAARQIRKGQIVIDYRPNRLKGPAASGPATVSPVSELTLG